MFLHRDKKWWDAALDRAERTVAQSLLSMMPAGFVITPIMIQRANWQLAYVLLGWILTACIAGLTSILTSYVKGVPEVDNE